MCYQCGEFNQIRSVTESDYGNGTPGPVLKTTTKYYKWEDPTASGSTTVGAQYLAAGLVDLPWNVQTVGTGGEETTYYYYDETTPVASSINTQTKGPLLSTVRGDLTSVSRSKAGGGIPKNAADSITTTVWYDTGMPYQTTDPNGNPATTYSYDTAYAGAYVTKTVDALGSSVSAAYDYNTGLMTSFTGINQANTTYTYDALRRPIKVLHSDTGEEDITYNVSLPAGQGNVVVKDLMDSRFDQHTIVYDGFGREIESQHNTDAISTTYVDTQYDLNGHAWSVSNPYRTKADLTYGLTKTYYDALGRETSSVLSDGTSTTSTSYSGAPYTWRSSGGNATYYGLAKTFTDPNKNQTIWTSNSLGLLGATVENANGSKNLPALTTVYLYDGLNNLTNVQQQGDGTNANAFRNRTFGYDGLSRLLSSTNGETGTISYAYDKNSNLTQKTDARGTITTYNYDALNRLASRTYNTAATGSNVGDLAHTPYSCYQYGTGTGNSLERLVLQWTEQPSSSPCQSSSNALTSRSISGYDSRGRVLNEVQCVGKTCSQNVASNNTYTYDLAGHLVSYGNLVGTALFTNVYDSGGQLSSISEKWSGNNVAPLFPGNLFSGATYAPHGALTTATLGANLTVLRTYDSRLRILSESDNGTTVQQPARTSSGNLTISGGVQSK